MDLKAYFKKDVVLRELREWAWSIAIAVLLFLIIKTYVIQAFKIPSGSMRPTLLEGDKLFVNKYVYRFNEPERGDIIVFKYPEDPKKDFIKRLVAEGGETVEIRANRIYVNGSPLEGPFARFAYYNHGPYGDPSQKIVVPTNMLYVLGDNSASSQDSRYWGFVPRRSVVGKAVFRWWPLNRIGKLE